MCLADSDVVRKTLRLPRCLRRGGMSGFDSGLNARCQTQCEGYAEGAAARDVIERSGKVIACLAGHTHWNARNTIDGVHDITIHSLTESFTTHPYPTGAFGVLAVDDSLTVEVFGRDPALHRLPLKPLGYHWQNLHRDFAPKPATLTRRMAALVEAGRNAACAEAESGSAETNVAFGLRRGK